MRIRPNDPAGVPVRARQRSQADGGAGGADVRLPGGVPRQLPLREREDHPARRGDPAGQVQLATGAGRAVDRRGLPAPRAGAVLLRRQPRHEDAGRRWIRRGSTPPPTRRRSSRRSSRPSRRSTPRSRRCRTAMPRRPVKLFDQSFTMRGPAARRDRSQRRALRADDRVRAHERRRSAVVSGAAACSPRRRVRRARGSVRSRARRASGSRSRAGPPATAAYLCDRPLSPAGPDDVSAPGSTPAHARRRAT